jgi:hypothetical protein
VSLRRPDRALRCARARQVAREPSGSVYSTRVTSGRGPDVTTSLAAAGTVTGRWCRVVDTGTTPCAWGRRAASAQGPRGTPAAAAVRQQLVGAHPGDSHRGTMVRRSSPRALEEWSATGAGQVRGTAAGTDTVWMTSGHPRDSLWTTAVSPRWCWGQSWGRALGGGGCHGRCGPRRRVPTRHDHATDNGNPDRPRRAPQPSCTSGRGGRLHAPPGSHQWTSKGTRPGGITPGANGGSRDPRQRKARSISYMERAFRMLPAGVGDLAARHAPRARGAAP